LPSPGELHIDVSEDRLRARFTGAAWPIDDGSEVRLRADTPGVYLFDGSGGRPLGPGHLGSWFMGDEGAQFSRVPITLRLDPGPIAEGPSELIGALLAEWTGQPRGELERQCGGGMVPQGFRFGAWIADLTAIVPMTLPRSVLRADAANPPRTITSA